MLFFRSLNYFALVLVLGACASITDRHQYVRIVPSTADTEIFYDQEKVGQGATTVHITRSAHPELELREKQQSKTIKLKTSYRWGQSFGGNILLYPYTPGGWLIDYWLGAAWEAEDRIAKDREFPLKDRSRLLILPTTNTNSVDSRMMGRKIERWFQSNHPYYQALPFNKTYYKVTGMGYDHESAKMPEDPDSLNELVHDTQATHLVFSEYDESTKQIALSVYSPYNEKVVKKYVINDVHTQVDNSTWNWIYTEIFEVVPNTLSLGTNQTFYDGCASQPDTTIRYCATSGSKTVLSYLSSISLTSILHFRKRQTWGLYFRFYPDFNLSYNQVAFSKTDPSLPDLNMDWVFMSLGYGPRVSFILPVGEMFFEVSPFLATNYLRLYSEQRYDKTHWLGQGGVSVQLGLNSWLANHWNMRWFVKVQSQNLLENHDISAVDPNSQFDGNLAVVQTGISVGYYFHEEETKFFDWLNLF